MSGQTLSRPTPVGVATKLVGVLLAVGALAWAWPDREAMQRPLRLEDELRDKQPWIGRHDVLAQLLATMRDMLAALRQRLPEHVAASAVEASLRARATDAGVGVASFVAHEETVREFHAELPVEVIVEGSTADIVRFVDGFARDEPMREITAMTIAAAGPVRRATLEIAYYRHVEEEP